MQGNVSTPLQPRCRKCGVVLGQSYLYCADGFMYHHMCYPVSPKEARILELERDNAALRDALKPFVFGDSAIADILWGDLPDDAAMKMTLPLGAYRRARSLLEATPTPSE